MHILKSSEIIASLEGQYEFTSIDCKLLGQNYELYKKVGTEE